MNNLISFLDTCKSILRIINSIDAAGGTAYVVGGSVRDLVLDRHVKDFDIEVHGLTLEQLEAVLKKFGPLKLVGKKFGVLRLLTLDIDWSLPRTDSLGRKPIVTIDPSLTIEQAMRRRDLTMNAMAINLNLLSKNFESIYQKASKTNNYKNIGLEIIDPYGGLKDMQDKKLRAVDTKLFLEDPLRFYRVMQFIGRFEMYPDNTLQEICTKINLNDPVTQKPVAKERVYEEIKKLFLKSRRPSLGFRWLNDIGRLQELFPEIHALIGVPQKPEYHPEGDVFEHTMQALDAAAIINLYQENESLSQEDEKFLIMIAALCHDLGKPITVDTDLSCKKHDQEGIKIAKKLLKRFTRDTFLIDATCKLVAAHMLPASFIDTKSKANPNAYKRLAKKLAPEVNLRQLALLTLADGRARNAESSEPLTGCNQTYKNFLVEAEKAQVLNEPEPAILMGRHLLEHIKPGKQLGELLKEAYRIQIEEGVTNLEELKSRVLSLI
ncbi:MAG: HD domain-containing protein [bacterium]